MSNPQVNSAFPLTAQENGCLEDLSRSRSKSVLRVRRATMLLMFSRGILTSSIARRFRCDELAVEKNIDMAFRQEVLSAREKEGKKQDRRVVTAEMLDWVRDLSCRNPRNLGYACVEWPASLLAQHVRDHCRAVGYHALADLRSVEIPLLLAQSEPRREMASANV